MRVVSEADAIQSLPALLREADRQAIVVCDGDRELAVIVSAKEYESMSQARIDRFYRRAMRWRKTRREPESSTKSR